MGSRGKGYFRSGLGSLRRGDCDKALEHFDKALDADPRLLSARFGRIRALIGAGRYPEAATEAFALAEELHDDGAYGRIADLRADLESAHPGLGEALRALIPPEADVVTGETYVEETSQP